MNVDGRSERRARDDDDELSDAAAAYWGLWLANWTPPFEDDAPWRAAAPTPDSAGEASQDEPAQDSPPRAAAAREDAA